MDILFRSNSSICFGSSIPHDIISKEDYFVEENDFTKFKKWCIPKVDTKSIYIKQVGFNLLLIQNSMLKLWSKLTLFQKLTKNVAYLIENALMASLLKNSIFCILAWFKLMLNLLPQKVLMLLYLCAYIYKLL